MSTNTQMDEDYNQLADECEKAGCYYPKRYELAMSIANAPMYLRVYFRMKGGNTQ